MKPYACSYEHDGDEWDFTVYAKDAEDARQRVRSIGITGRAVGRRALTINLGFIQISLLRHGEED